MTKSIFLVFVLGISVCCAKEIHEKYIEELDEIFYTMAVDVNNPDILPETVEDIYESWCRPLLPRTMRVMELVEGLFSDNPILLVLFRVGEMTKLSTITKICLDERIMEYLAKANGVINNILPVITPRLLAWYEMVVNTYLAAAKPDSKLDVGDLVCLLKKMWKRLIDELPLKWQQGIIKQAEQLEQTQSFLSIAVLRHMNIDLNQYVCHIPRKTQPNPYGIRSKEMAAFLAWDRVLRRYSRHVY